MYKNIIVTFLTIIFMTGCQSSVLSDSNFVSSDFETKELEKKLPQRVLENSAKKYSELSTDETLKRATFAGGCFWCMEGPFESQEGVIESFSGFAGGDEENPHYEDVSRGKTNHREAVQVFYDPKIISYKDLLEVFWHQIDPTDEGGQFGDRGFHYTTAIFWHDGLQKEKAEKFRKILNDSDEFKKSVVTKIIPFTNFYLASEDHQNYYLKQSSHYKRYKKGSGRARLIKKNERAIDKIFKKENISNSKKIEKKDSSYDLSPEEIEQKLKNLDPLSYHVVAGNGTEKPFFNKYWNNKKDGIYVDKITGEPLFSSTHKYDSGTGWPTFYRSIRDNILQEKEDLSLGIARTEVRSRSGDSHLGHVFDDGPVDKGGKRFCVNSASLKFIPVQELEKNGYEKYKYLFEK